jgi:hypothetical protein
MNTTSDLVNLPAPASKTRPSIWTFVALLVGAVVPVLVALVLLGSALLHRPLFARLVRRWPELAHAAAVEGHAVVTRVTVIWGIGLLVIGALQGGAELAGLSLTDPVAILVRTLGALALEAVLYLASDAYLRTRTRTSNLSAAVAGSDTRRG